MTALVIVLAFAFVVTAVSVRSTVIPTVPEGALLSAVALIGTTVVP